MMRGSWFETTRSRCDEARRNRAGVRFPSIVVRNDLGTLSSMHNVRAPARWSGFGLSPGHLRRTAAGNRTLFAEYQAGCGCTPRSRAHAAEPAQRGEARITIVMTVTPVNSVQLHTRASKASVEHHPPP
jgi:hypothetical protein